MKLTPTSEQEAAIEKIVSEPTKSALIAAELGTGKTLISVEAALRLGVRTVLVAAPLGTRVGWERRFAGQGWTAPIHRVTSKAEGKAAFEALKAKQAGVYIVGREYLRRLDWSKVKPDLVIADECHFFANRKSVSNRKMNSIKSTYRFGVSGTWFGNKFENAWAITRWLWPDKTIVDNSFWRWASQWAKIEYDPFAGQKITGEKNPGAYVAQLPCYIYIKAADFDVVEDVRYVELTPTQRKMYNQMELESVAWLGENPLVSEVPITQRIRLRQMTLGTVTFNAEGEVDFALNCNSGKIEMLKEILSDLDDEPVLILTDSARFAKVVKHRLGDKAALWIGGVSHKEREALIDSFGRSVQYLVATIPAIAEGVDGLQDRCANMVWLSKSENALMNEQVSKRLVRTGQTRPVTSYEIVAENTLDEGVMSRLLQTMLENRQSLGRK